MKKRLSKIISEDEHLQLWRSLETRSFPKEVEQRESKERKRLEASIFKALSSFGEEGWDFVVDHYRPPDFVCRFTIQNKLLHRQEVILAALEAFDKFEEPWVFDLGLTDSVEGVIFKCGDDLGRIIVIADQVLLDGELGLGSIPLQLHPTAQ
jgi:hypothetical protein